jgi:hypothetical protein
VVDLFDAVDGLRRRLTALLKRERQVRLPRSLALGIASNKEVGYFWAEKLL